MYEKTIIRDSVYYSNLLQKHVMSHVSGLKNRRKETFSPSIIYFLENSFQDYVAARVLLNSNMLLQGSVLANTFVEKALKALLFINDDSFRKRVHDCSELLKIAIETEPVIENIVSKPFVDFLSKVYKTRYYEALDDIRKNNLSISISYRRTLAEMDYLAFVLHNLYSISSVKEGPHKNSNLYMDGYNSGDDKLWFNNYILGDLDKTYWIEEFPDRTHQLTFISLINDVPFEVHGYDIQAYNDGQFDLPCTEINAFVNEDNMIQIRSNEIASIHKKHVNDPDIARKILYRLPNSMR